VFLAAMATVVVSSSMVMTPCEPTANVLVPVRRIIPVDGAKRIESEDEKKAIEASSGKVAIFAITTNSSGRVVSQKLVCATMNDVALSLAQRSIQRYVFKSGEPLEGQVLLHLAVETNAYESIESN